MRVDVITCGDIPQKAGHLVIDPDDVRRPITCQLGRKAYHLKIHRNPKVSMRTTGVIFTHFVQGSKEAIAAVAKLPNYVKGGQE